MQALRRLALKYPEAQEGIACAGTAIEKRTIKARNKAFLFLGVNDAMFKVSDSAAEIASLAAERPTHVKIGATGWVTLKFDAGKAVPPELLAKWIGESYRLVAPKQLVALLPSHDTVAAVPVESARKKRPKKKSGKKA